MSTLNVGLNIKQECLLIVSNLISLPIRVVMLIEPLRHTQAHMLSIEVASWYQNVTNLKACKVYNEGMIVNECHLLFTRSTYSAIRSRYVDILKGSVNLSAILKTTPRRFSSMSMLYSRVHCSMYFNVWIPFLGKRNISRTCKLAKIDLFMDDKKF